MNDVFQEANRRFVTYRDSRSDTSWRDAVFAAEGTLPVSARSLMTMRIVHGISVKLSTIFRWTFAASRHRPVEALAIVEMMIDMSVKMLWPVEPWPRADEDTA